MTIDEILYKALGRKKCAGGAWVRDENGNLVTDENGDTDSQYTHQVERVFGNRYLKNYPVDSGQYAIADADSPNHITIISADALGYSLDDLKKMKSASYYFPLENGNYVPINNNYNVQGSMGQIAETAAPLSLVYGNCKLFNSVAKNMYSRGLSQWRNSNGTKGVKLMQNATKVAKVGQRLVNGITRGLPVIIDAAQFATSKDRGDRTVNAIEGLIGLAGSFFHWPGIAISTAVNAGLEGNGTMDAIREIGNSTLPDYMYSIRHIQDAVNHHEPVYPIIN